MRVALGAASVLVLSLLVAGCGGSNGLAGSSTAKAAASAGTSAVVRLTRALYRGGLPGGVRWKPKAM